MTGNVCGNQVFSSHVINYVFKGIREIVVLFSHLGPELIEKE